MLQVNIHEAKTHLSKLVDRAHAGETIIIAKNGVPWAGLTPDPLGLLKSGADSIQSKRQGGLGSWAGKIAVSDDCWEEDEETISAMTTITPDDPLWEFATDNPDRK